MAKAIITVPIDWSNGKELPDGTWTGARAILPTTECGDDTDCLEGGGFSGWYSGNEPGMITLKMAEKDKLPQAHVHIWCSEENLVKTSKAKKKDGKFKFKIKKLVSEKAQLKKDELDPLNDGGE